jgi:ABC-type Zn uptake system ZnuABC Zn-binding protein ZnuA
VVFRSGGAVDDWLGELVESAGGSARTVSLLEAVEKLELAGEIDPHWWQDPRNAVRAVGSIRDALAAADPDRRAGHRRAATAYTRELRALDRELAECFERVPADRRKLVTTHDSLAYLARRYDLEVVQELVDEIEREGVSAVFPESGLPQKLERAIARESGARVGGELWTDSLGKAGSGADTYLRAMRANADSLVRAMTGGARGCR